MTFWATLGLHLVIRDTDRLERGFRGETGGEEGLKRRDYIFEEKCLAWRGLGEVYM